MCQLPTQTTILHETVRSEGLATHTLTSAYNYYINIYTYVVSHDAQLVQGRLSVEQHHISIYQVSLHHITKLQGWGGTESPSWREGGREGGSVSDSL